MTAGRDLPWLQDETGEVTTNWAAGYRDFVILDPANGRPVDAYNLTANSLGVAANYEELKSILLGQAVYRDGDGDGLSDYWEEEMFEGDTAPGPSDDGDGDKASALLEFGLASRADSAASLPRVATGTFAIGENRYHTISFPRRLGASGGLAYFVESDRDLMGWSFGFGEVFEVRAVNPYDGTGTEIVTYRSAHPIASGAAAQGQLRVRVELP